MLSTGDLYIVAMTITIAGVVELGMSHEILSKKKLTGWSIMVALVSTAPLAFAAFRYADGTTKIKEAVAAHERLADVFDVPAFAHDSIWVFVASLFLSSWCVSMTKDS